MRDWLGGRSRRGIRRPEALRGTGAAKDVGGGARCLAVQRTPVLYRVRAQLNLHRGPVTGPPMPQPQKTPTALTELSDKDEMVLRRTARGRRRNSR